MVPPTKQRVFVVTQFSNKISFDSLVFNYAGLREFKGNAIISIVSLFLETPSKSLL